MDTVDVVIVSYGDFEHWEPLLNRAVESVRNQTRPADNIWCEHQDGDASLGSVRNCAAAHSTADWLIFLDADDELDPEYIEWMLQGTTDIRQPATLGVVDGVEDDYPVVIPPKPNILTGNHLVIGSMVRRELFQSVGGFRPLPVLEDWDLWIRCFRAGATWGVCPKAIYRVHVRQGSRNTDLALHGAVYQQIQQEYS